jgi:ribokinase
MHVVGIGQCALDYLFVVEHFPSPDTKTEVIEWAVCGGGPVATALVSLSRLDIRTSFYGVTGDDENGKKIEDSLVSESVNVRGLIKRRGTNSQTAFIAVEKGSGRRTIFWKRPSGSPLNPEEIPEDFCCTKSQSTEYSGHARCRQITRGYEGVDITQ